MNKRQVNILAKLFHHATYEVDVKQDFHTSPFYVHLIHHKTHRQFQIKRTCAGLVYCVLEVGLGRHNLNFKVVTRTLDVMDVPLAITEALT
jgi:hypothetical protein